MFRNFLKIALRNLYKQRLFAAFNILGIAAGIACCIVVYLLIQHQNNQDAFHRDADRIFLVNHVRTANGTDELWSPTFAPLGPALRAELPEVKYMVRFHGAGAVVKRGDQVFQEYIRMADPDFFRLFTFPLQRGSNDPLSDPSHIVLSSEAAIKYFGQADPLGQSLTLIFYNGVKRSFTVSAVAAPFPNTASFSFDMMTSYAVGKELGWQENNWKEAVEATFIGLNSPASAEAVTRAMNAKYVKLHNEVDPTVPLKSFYLDNIRDVGKHAYKTRYSFSGGTSPTGMIVLGILATLVLFLSCFNYMNHTIATSTTRFKEIGVRKVLGSTRMQLIRQFIGENLLTGLLALALALVLTETLFLPTFSRIIDFYQLRFNLLENWDLLLFLLALIVGIGLLSGLYPSLYISSYNPVSVLKGTQRIRGTNGLIRTLLVFQFGLSMFTVVSAIITTQNAEFMRHTDVGYRQDQLMVLRAGDAQSYEQLRQAALSFPGVSQVAGSQDQIGQGGDHMTRVEYGSDRLDAQLLRVTPEYIQTLDLRLLEGRNFMDKSQLDVENALIVNQAFVKAMGWPTAVGRKVRVAEKQYEVVGVVKDFNYRLFFFKIAPCVLSMNSEADNRLLTARLNSPDAAPFTRHMETAWKKAMPDTPFRISRQEDVFSISYDESRRIKDVFTYVALLTLLISAMGLFALVSLNIAKKTKEIGIRKVLGASAFSIARILNREFFILITIAGGLFLPLAYLTMGSLLDSVYAYHTPITPGAFVTTLGVMLVLAVITIGSQVYKIVTANPVKALRTE